MRFGVDLAKTVFQIHGVEAQKKPVCRRQLRRSQLLGIVEVLKQ
jgi:transposase